MRHKTKNHEDYIKPWKTEDKISVCLDLKQAQLSLTLNGKKNNIVFENIEKSKIKSRFFASFFCIGDSIEILDYTIIP